VRIRFFSYEPTQEVELLRKCTAVVIVWSLVTSPFVSYNKSKTTKRVIGDSTIRFFTSSLSIAQIQYTTGTDRHIYESWVKQNNLPIVAEELGEDAELFWIGPKRTDRVILYFHGASLITRSRHYVTNFISLGGAYMAPMQDFTASFWRYVQLELEKGKIEVGFAILSYC